MIILVSARDGQGMKQHMPILAIWQPCNRRGGDRAGLEGDGSCLLMKFPVAPAASASAKHGMRTILCSRFLVAAHTGSALCKLASACKR
eukprot:6172870-Pleurochrysis_carterae.AAC.3